MRCRKDSWLGTVLGPCMLFIAGAGCLSVEAPENIQVGSQRPDVDASRIPPTRDHEDARQKLAEAYSEIRWLRDEVEDLKEDNRELRRERDQCEERLERLEDAYDD